MRFADRQSLPRGSGSVCLVAEVAVEEGIVVALGFLAEEAGGVGGALGGLELFEQLTIAAGMEVGLLLGGEALREVLEMGEDFGAAVLEHGEAGVALVEVGGLEEAGGFGGALVGEAAEFGFDAVEGLTGGFAIGGELREVALFGLFATAANREQSGEREDEGHAG